MHEHITALLLTPADHRYYPVQPNQRVVGLYEIVVALSCMVWGLGGTHGL